MGQIVGTAALAGADMGEVIRADVIKGGRERDTTEEIVLPQGLAISNAQHRLGATM
jgi:hypothetical protein